MTPSRVAPMNPVTTGTFPARRSGMSSAFARAYVSSNTGAAFPNASSVTTIRVAGTATTAQRVRRPGRGRDDDDALPGSAAHDADDALERVRRRDRCPTELEDDAHFMARAIWITSPSIADAVASPPAPGPMNVSVPARSVSR